LLWKLHLMFFWTAKLSYLKKMINFFLIILCFYWLT